MEILFKYQEAQLQQVDDRFFRSLFDHVDWEQRMLGITGLRGTGKTTMLLQYLKYRYRDTGTALYVSADYTWFYNNSLIDLAENFVLYGGQLLLIDEIHKYPNWSRELKNIYDFFPDLRVIFTASSVFDILKGEADLSRRAITYELTGLSFREYLALNHQLELPVITLEAIINSPKEAVKQVLPNIKPLPYFREYLKTGYFPFMINEKEMPFFQKLNQIVNTVLEVDLHFIQGYSADNVSKIKRLLSVVSESGPFEPNISKIANKLHLGRDTVKTYLQNLHKARMLNLVSKYKKGIAGLQKPDKIYPENTNLSYALHTNPDQGTLRETFFVNQLTNAGYQVHLSEKGDFVVDETRTFEIGGKKKDTLQIKNIPNSYLALDDLENPYLNRVPLWLFGFLY